MLKIYTKISTKLHNVKADEEGASAIEYALIVGGIALLVLTAASDLGTAVSNRFGEITTALTPAP